MGVVINMEPELFNGVKRSSLVDVINTMDESILFTPCEFDEWGNPKEKEYYDYMKSYSPYDNIMNKNYPNILLLLDIGIVKFNIGSLLSGLLRLEIFELMIIYYSCIVIWMRGMEDYH